MALRIICEKGSRNDKFTFIAFMGVKKAFDNVNWVKDVKKKIYVWILLKKKKNEWINHV